ncbi:MAG: nitroreductase family protein [Clostridia bacterium]|nr:nitroreductase family protein [Clostridia bacterium]
MNFMEIAKNRQSCRRYRENRPVEQEKIEAILEAARLAPSACNGQPYHLTVCMGESAKAIAKATQGKGMNAFTSAVPVFIVIAEDDYVKRAELGAKVMGIDYRSIDIGICAAYITAEATAQGLGSCIIGWMDNGEIQRVCAWNHPARLVICIGYADDDLRPKKRKSADELITRL